ncbi:MAG TPA: putative glycoside hydrolase [Candidatus Paceibacterota bacterium]|nr:putative glycoside hydrolase [Candidatus Paceibacterota bacterium]
MSFKNTMYCVGLVAFASVVVFGVYAGSDTFGRISYENVISSSTSALETLLPLEKKASHVDVPDAVRAIYMTSCTATRRDLRDRLVALVDETELNSIVIDIKTYDGRISFPVENPVLVPAQGGSCFVPDMKEFLEELHEKNIYVIGRIAVFQDVFMVKEKPQLAVKKDSDRSAIWKDHKGIPWIDAGAVEHWEYIKTLAEESYEAGFDELNFDYIRFPSDGNMKDIYYPVSEGKKKSDVIESFFEYLHGALDDTGAYLSADLFGMVTTNTDDLNIGQVLEKALPYFDYIAPMVYPSHYPFNFHNLGDPNKDPYGVVHYSMETAVSRTVASSTVVQTKQGTRIASTTPPLYTKESFDKNKLRPWLQDNNYPVPYTPEMVRAQIQATYDAGLNSWMLWNASNRYTRSALEAE